MPEFVGENFEAPETKWLIDSFIPLSHLCIVLAQSGVGKSLFLEFLAVCVAYGTPFCGFPTDEGDVLIIDQDTPTNTLLKRLSRFTKGIGIMPKHKIFYESMGDYYLSNFSLIQLINSTTYRNVKFVLIDSLHSVCGQYDPNRTRDMTLGLGDLKAQCLTDNRTIMINHHISEKLNVGNQELLSGDTHSLSMGNSAIIQQADTYYIVGAEAVGGVTTKMYIRPVAKRASIPLKPVILRFVSLNGTGEKMELEGFYEVGLTSAELDIITLFKDQPADRSVKEVFDILGQKHAIRDVRTSLKSLADAGKLVWAVQGHNKYKYRLP